MWLFIQPLPFSLIRVVDPRIKAILFFALMTSVFLFHHAASLFFLLGAWLLAVLFSHAPLKPYGALILKVAVSLLIFCGVLFVLAGELKPVFLTGFKLFLVFCFSSLFMLTTSQSEFIDTVETFFLFVKRRLLRVFPAEEMALMLLMGFRFVPLFVQEFQRVSISMAARGAIWDYGFAGKAYFLSRSLTAVLTGIQKKAKDISLCLEIRGYQPGMKRPMVTLKPFGKNEAVAVIVTCLTLVLSFLFS